MPWWHRFPPGRSRRIAARTFEIGLFDRVLDTAWRRTSYSALSAAAEQEPHAGVSSEPEDGERDDESLRAGHQLGRGPSRTPRGRVADGRAAGRYLVRHPGARHPGDTDPTAADLPAELRLRCASSSPDGRPGSAPTSSPRVCCRCWPRRSARSPPAWHSGTSRSVTGWPSSTSRSRSVAEISSRTSRPLSPWAISASCCAAPARRRPARRVRRAAANLPGCPGNRCAAISPAAWTPCFRLPGPRYVVADYKTNWLGDRRHRAAVGVALPAAGVERGDGGLGLSLAGTAVLRCAAPVPAVAAARLRPAAASRRRAVPLRPRDVRRATSRWSTGNPAGCSAGVRRPNWWSGCRTCWTGGADDHRCGRDVSDDP